MYKVPANTKPAPPELMDVLNEHKESLLDASKKASSWQEIHTAFAEYDLEIKKRGNGLVIANSSDEPIAISQFDRSLAKKALEMRLGTFERADSVLDQIMKAPEMLGSILDGCEDWQDVHNTLEQFDLSLSYREQGYFEASFDQRNDLLDAGARFDKKVKHWYVPNDAKLDDFTDFKRGYILSDGQYHILSHALPGLDAECLNKKFGDRQQMAQQFLLDTLQTAESWQDVHQRLHEQGFKYTKRKATQYRAESYHFHDGNESVNCENMAGYADFEQNSKLGEFEASQVGKTAYQPRPLIKFNGKKERGMWDQFLEKKRLKPALTWGEYLLLMAGFDPLALAILATQRKMLAALHSPAPNGSINLEPAPYNPLAGEKYMPMYIRVPLKDSEVAKAAGAKWDPDQQSWFIPHDKQSVQDRESFKQWPVGLPESQQSFSKKRMYEMGGVNDRALGLGD